MVFVLFPGYQIKPYAKPKTTVACVSRSVKMEIKVALLYMKLRHEMAKYF